MSQLFAPYTLGYENNPIIPNYFSLLEDKLLFLWKKFSAYTDNPQYYLSQKDEYLLPFINITDISANLLFFERKGALDSDIQTAVKFITDEFQLYVEGGIGAMLSIQGYTIPGTKIILSNKSYIPSSIGGIAHPEHDPENTGSGFGDISAEEWGNLYGKSFDLLKIISPGFFHELNMMIQKIIAFGVSDRLHNSASYGSVIGHVYSSYPLGYDMPDVAVLEAIVHESNHNKINLIRMVDPLILNDRQTIYYSPYRPDARHIEGIYLGLHAMAAAYYVLFIAIQNGLIPMESPFIQKGIVYVLKNQLAIKTLQRYGKFTHLGQVILDDMIAVHGETLRILKSIGFSKNLLEQSQRSTRQHFQKAHLSNRVLYY